MKGRPGLPQIEPPLSAHQRFVMSFLKWKMPSVKMPTIPTPCFFVLYRKKKDLIKDIPATTMASDHRRSYKTMLGVIQAAASGLGRCY